MQIRNLTLAAGAVLLCGAVISGCSTDRVTDRAEPIEGIWSLQSIECHAGSDLTADGKKWESRLESHLEAYVMRYTHGGMARVYGKSFQDKNDEMNYCDIEADLEWTDRQLPSVCDYHAQTTRRGHATDEACNDQYRYVADLCVWTGSSIQGNTLKFSLGDTSQAKSKSIDNTFLPKLCEDGQPVLVFERVL